MKKKYTPIAIVLTSIGCTLLLASTLDSRAEVSATDPMSDDFFDTLLDGDLDQFNNPVDDNEGLIDDPMDSIDDFMDEDEGLFDDPMDEDEGLIQDPMDENDEGLFDDPMDSYEDYMNEDAGNFDDPLADPTPSYNSAPTLAPATSAPVFYRNGKVVEITPIKPDAPEVEENPEDQFIDNPETQGGAVDDPYADMGDPAVDEIGDPETDKNAASTENKITETEEIPTTDEGGISMLLIGATIAILLMSAVLIIWLIKRKKKCPPGVDISKLTGEPVDVKPEPKFAQHKSDRLDQVLTSLDGNGNHTETSPKAPDLDRDAVLPVNHLPPEMVKPTDVRTEPKEPSQNATQVEKPATASRPEKQAPAPQEKVEEIPQKTDQNPPGQKPPTSDPDTPHTN